MDDLTAKLKQYEFFKDMDFELEPLLLKSYNHGKIFVVKNLESGEKYKLRLKHPNFPDTVTKELRVLRYIEQFPGHEIFPQVLFTDGNDEVLVLTYFEGLALNKELEISAAEKNDIVKKIYRQLQVLHKMECPPKDIITDTFFSSWYERIKLIFDSYVGKVKEHNLLNAGDEAMIYDFIELNKPYLLNVKTSVIHGDLKPANIVWNPDSGKVSLIDFESGKIGDPLFDYYRLNSDGWGFSEELERDSVYVLYLINVYLRWLVYALVKRNFVEPRATDGLTRSLRLASKLF